MLGRRTWTPNGRDGTSELDKSLWIEGCPGGEETVKVGLPIWNHGGKMHEVWLRCQGRMGALKPWALIVGIISALFLLIVAEDLNRAIRNRAGPVTVSVHDLVENHVGPDRFVAISGTASYLSSYQEVQYGSIEEVTYPLVLQAIDYPLVDEATRDVIFVRTLDTGLARSADQSVTVLGMTHSTPSGLRSLIARDAWKMRAAGFEISTALYVVEGEQPADVRLAALEVLVLGGLLFASIATLFFSSTVFDPQPIRVAPQPIEGEIDLKLTGRLHRLKAVPPGLAFARGTRRFRQAIAKVFTSKEGWLGLYVHHLQTNSLDGIQRARQETDLAAVIPRASFVTICLLQTNSRNGIQLPALETDWAVVIPRASVLAIRPGRVYGWRDHPAISIQYKDGGGRVERLLLTFEADEVQAAFFDYLRAAGYMERGMAADRRVPAW